MRPANKAVHSADVRRGGVDPAVPAPSDRQVEDIRPRSVLDEIAERRAAGELVRAQELGIHHPGGLAHALPHQLVERCPGRAPCDQREHHVAAVAVGEAFAGRELRLQPAEHLEVLLRGPELMGRDGQHVVDGVSLELLVEVVADARAVRQ